MTIEIPDNPLLLAEDGTRFLVTPDAEASLIALKEAQERIEEALDLIKQKVKETIEAEMPTLTSVKGNRVTLSVQQYGSKYSLDEAFIDQVDPSLYEKKVSYSVDSDKVEKMAKELGGLPVGIMKPDRNKTVKLLIKKES